MNNLLQTTTVNDERGKIHTLGFLYGNVLFWRKHIDPDDYQINKIKKIIHNIVIWFLVIILIAGLAALGYHLYTSLSVTNANQLPSLIYRPPNYSFEKIFILTLLFDLYLIYELSKNRVHTKSIITQYQNSDTGRGPNFTQLSDLKSWPKKLQIDIEKSFSPEAIQVLSRAVNLSKKYNHSSVRAADLLIASNLESIPVSNLLYRLGVTIKDLSSEIAPLVSEPNTETETNYFDDKLEKILIQAYYLAFQNRSEKVEAHDLFEAAVFSDQRLLEIFFTLSVTENDLRNVVQWARINSKQSALYRRYRGQAGYRSKSGIDRAMTAIQTQFLDSVSQDLTRLAQQGYLGLAVGRDEITTELVRLFESGNKNILLVGNPGTGKSTILESLAERIVGDDVPDFLKEKRLVSMSVTQLLSGAASGNASNRLLKALYDTANGRNVVLCLENIDQLMGVGYSQEGLDLLGVLSEVLDKKIFYFIATVDQGNYKSIERSGIMNHLSKVSVEEMNQDETVQVLESKVSLTEAKTGVRFSYQALQKIYEITNRYIHESFQPHKSVAVLDEVAVFVKNSKGAGSLILAEDVAALMSQKLKIPLTQVTGEESSKLLDLESFLHERVIGQDEAVKAVSNSLRRARTELRSAKRPIANLMFLGPTGVGKTELAKAVAQSYFGSEDSMVRLDMSEFQTKPDLYKMIGTPDGEVGYLTEAVRKNPFTIVLLDELEKAHPDIMNLFLQVMEDGRLTDSLGQTVDFTNVILIATSNAGSAAISEMVSEGESIEVIKQRLLAEELNQFFRPEFLNRFDNIIVFTPLTEVELKEIAKLMLQKIGEQLEEKGYYFRFTDEALDDAVAGGYDPKFGARPLRRFIQDKIDNGIAELMLKGELQRRDTIVLESGGLLRVEKAGKI